MLPENALLESRAIRESLTGRTDVLDKVKVLETLPDGMHVTTRMLAEYYEVEERVLNKVIQRHREELESNGFCILRGADLERFKGDITSLYREQGMTSYPQARSSLALWPRRAILNIGMLLRDSVIARRVRTYLLNVEEQTTRPAPWTYEEPAPAATDIGDAVRHIGSVLEGMSYRLDSMDRRLTQTQHVVNAINVEVCALRHDVHRMDLRMDLAGLPRLPDDDRPRPLPRGGRRRRRG
ncbi:hypothetical protein SRB5_40010 [Streptomyces sp. RB5]|uniref:Uncharacterized protein n=1 Tax=Streptomyces smaragdinus TaxID=2585196 RepID=A0A7K0CK14_9ACTN|nr:hypothetical protein [Streptomyces smaragdinus]MQY13845.1 hypothetical protein [Streptomyces smaragdinus]